MKERVSPPTPLMSEDERHMWLPAEFSNAFAVGYNAAVYDSGNRLRPRLSYSYRFRKDGARVVVEFRVGNPGA